MKKVNLVLVGSGYLGNAILINMNKIRHNYSIIEIAKAFGLSRDIQQALSAQVWGTKSTSPDSELLHAAGLDSEDTKLQLILKLVLLVNTMIY